MSKPLVIYHGNCADGFTAAWLANIYFYRKRAGVHPQLPNRNLALPTEWVVDAHAGVYGEPPPPVDGRAVYILDFSYPRVVMADIVARSERVVWIDHHASAIKDMEGTHCPGLTRVLSTERSGAYLTSEYFFPGREPEDMVKLVDDRDRWQFRDPRSKAFAAGLFSRPYAIGEWNRASRSVPELVKQGEAILEKHWKDIRELLDVMTRTVALGGAVVPAANLPYTMASDACHELLERFPDAPFAACWYLRKDGKYVVSLRSRNGSDVDVAEIAKQYGGGGHKHAAGFAIEQRIGGMW